jgi:hypothetical protein
MTHPTAATHPHPAFVRASVHPTCEYYPERCRRLSVGAVLVNPTRPDVPHSWRARCPGHLPPDAPRWCVVCSVPSYIDNPATSHCTGCRDGTRPRAR